jgi:adenylate cyclase
MPQEIERKFLVKNNSYKTQADRIMRITQGYLCSVPERSVRVRIIGDRGYLTIKGAANSSGTTRYEWEKEISVNDADELLKICEPGTIDKTRYLVKIDEFIYEVDEFHGDNEGLVIAEIELPSEDISFRQAPFLGQEVTGDPRYYNSMLVKKPYKNW